MRLVKGQSKGASIANSFFLRKCTVPPSPSRTLRIGEVEDKRARNFSWPVALSGCLFCHFLGAIECISIYHLDDSWLAEKGFRQGIETSGISG
jgi:hypothetical protein